MKYRDARWPQPIHAHGVRKQARFAPDRDTHVRTHTQSLETFLVVHSVFSLILVSVSFLCLSLRISGMQSPEPSLGLPCPPSPTHTKPLCPVKEILFRELSGRSHDPLAVLSQPFPHPLLFPKRFCQFSSQMASTLTRGLA